MMVEATPSRIDPAAAEELLQRVKSLVVLYPAFDEDGRVAFWQEMTKKEDAGRVQQNELQGVGIEVGWTAKIGATRLSPFFSS